MKICFITPLFDPWNIGGAEKYINILAKSFSKNHDVIVITTKGTHPRESKTDNLDLKKSIDSVLSQTHIYFELIIAFKKNSERILYFMKKNLVK